MDYKVILSQLALRDLEKIARFIASGEHGSPAAALRIAEELIRQSEPLAKLPYRGIAVRSLLRKLSHRYYLIYYRVTEADRRVEIVRIWDGRQAPSALALL